jgi:hypothetical protein
MCSGSRLALIIKNDRLAAVGWVWATYAAINPGPARGHYRMTPRTRDRKAAACVTCSARCSASFNHCLQTRQTFDAIKAFGQTLRRIARTGRRAVVELARVGDPLGFASALRLAKRWLCRRERRQSRQASTILSASPRGLVNITSWLPGISRKRCSPRRLVMRGCQPHSSSRGTVMSSVGRM